MAIKVPRELKPSNRVGEILAVKEADYCPKDIPLTVYSDSKYTIGGLTKNLTKWENEDFLTISNRALAQTTVSRIRARKARTRSRWVKGH